MTPERIAELRKALEGVTRGEWVVHGRDGRTQPILVGLPDIGTRYTLFKVMTPQGASTTEAESNAEFIATFSPPVVSELLDTVERLREALETAANNFGQIAMDYGLGDDRCLEIGEYAWDCRTALSGGSND